MKSGMQNSLISPFGNSCVLTVWPFNFIIALNFFLCYTLYGDDSMISAKRVSVQTAATQIEIPDSDTQQESVTVYLRNLDASNNVDLGGTNVTYGTGFTLKPGDIPLAVTVRNGDALYAAAQTAPVVVAVLVNPVG